MLFEGGKGLMLFEGGKGLMLFDGRLLHYSSTRHSIPTSPRDCSVTNQFFN